MTLSIATWNVNSIKQRLPHLMQYAQEEKPDILLLQELKCTKDAFPYLEIEELGYNAALVGEKSYNGVAILSKFPLDDICDFLPGDASDTHARYIEAVVSLPQGGALRVASVYVPNGQEVGSNKFHYKLAFLERLQAHMQGLLAYEEMLVVGGDYNVAPLPSDVYDPAHLNGSVCYHPEERARFRAIEHLGLYDAYRLLHPNPGEHGYTWWDYRAGSWAMNKGMRIDHLLLSPQAADRLTQCEVAKQVRGWERASDHAPVAVQLVL